MTNQEAINYLLDPLSLPHDMDIMDKLNWHEDAVNMAIEALSSSEIPNSSDTIYRQAVIDALYDWSEHSMTDAEAWHIRQVIGDIKSMPSVQHEIIRCRDCISYQEGIDIDGKPFTRCNGSVRTYGHTLPDWYCADAERRTDE